MQKQQQTLSAVAVNAKIVGTTMHIVNSTGSQVQTTRKTFGSGFFVNFTYAIQDINTNMRNVYQITS